MAVSYMKSDDAALEALDRMRKAAAKQGFSPTKRPATTDGRSRSLTHQRSSRSSRNTQLGGLTGPGDDPRDPKPVGSSMDAFVKSMGWSGPLKVAGVVGRWDSIVGDDVARHCQPVSFSDGVLTVKTDSTAWATQMRLLIPQLTQRLSDDIGPGIVQKIVIHGPSSPSWSKGRRSARYGRGPRDTYG